LRSFRACSRTGLRYWNGSSDTMESTLLNDWSKTFSFRRAAEIGGWTITFCTPSIKGRFEIQVISKWSEMRELGANFW
jgi:hypothetical protein